ncbi:hypothetical protein HCA58_01620 [Micromonospora sp. HNM0581]|nr:hypothetical protein [Micromonospora sp. HNM0581]NLU77112.1 hypothetical protein [Micromonospora sp. HNM0581]
MSAQRLGRLIGSLLLVSSLVVVSGVAVELNSATNSFEWNMPLLGTLLS